MNTKMIPFADRINEYLKVYDLTQIAFSGRVGYSKQTVNSWCAGKSSPNMSDVPALAEKMGVSVAWLMGFPTAKMHNNDDAVEKELTEVLHEKIKDQEVMDTAPREEINGSMYPVYTREQLDKRLDMIGRAFDMFNDGKIDQKMFELIVNSLR